MTAAVAAVVMLSRKLTKQPGHLKAVQSAIIDLENYGLSKRITTRVLICAGFAYPDLGENVPKENAIGKPTDVAWWARTYHMFTTHVHNSCEKQQFDM